MKSVLILASASPRRRTLLSPFFKLSIRPPKIDERSRKNEASSTYVKRISLEKWKAIANCSRKIEVVVAADTIVVLKNKILGKPSNAGDARRMLSKLSGRTHSVMTSVCVGWTFSKTPKFHFLKRTSVKFRKLKKAEIEVYLSNKGWRGKAGSYAIQGEALKFIDEIQGSLTNVVGLPLFEALKSIEKCFSQPPSAAVKKRYHDFVKS